MLNRTAQEWHAMTDLETVALDNKAAVIQIGIILFDPMASDVSVNRLVIKVDLFTSLMCGLSIDAGTVKWWRDQDPKAIASVAWSREAPTLGFSEALDMLTNWWGEHKPVALWGHGAATDVTWLNSAYQSLGMKTPWDHRAPRDTRTLFEVAGRYGWTRPEFSGVVEHDALEDAISQAREVQSANRFLAAMNELATKDEL